LVLTANRIGK